MNNIRNKMFVLTCLLVIFLVIPESILIIIDAPLPNRSKNLEETHHQRNSIHSRQSIPSYYYDNNNLFKKQSNYIKYPFINNQNLRPLRPPYPQESLMDILFSVAQNDDYHCIPRLLCEMTSGMISGRQNFLPININMESILGLLSTINTAEASPVLVFGKAILLGYSSSNYPESCLNSYPKCPRDPDRLVQYLNNHNGGFFRFFNGINTQNKNSYINGQPMIEAKIQNKPVEYLPDLIQSSLPQSINSNNEIIQFPALIENINDDYFENNNYYRSSKSIRFPSDSSLNSDINNSIRQPKRLPLNFNYYYYNSNDNNEDLYFPKAPNHQAVPMIFPDRTGTGDLRLDLEELTGNNYYGINKNVIKFNANLT